MIITLSGNNGFLLSKALRQKIDDFKRRYGDLAVERLDGEECSHEQIIDAISGISMFASNRLVVVKNFTADKLLVEHLEGVLGQVPDTTTVILVSSKIDKRSSAYKLLKKSSEFVEYTSGSINDIPGWITSSAKAKGGSIDRSTAVFLVDRVGNNQALLDNELEKLITYDPQITRQSVELLCEPLPQSTTFQLLDAAFAGNVKKTQALYEDQRQQKVEPLAILGMIAWQLHILAIVKTAQGLSAGEIARNAGLSPFVVSKSQNIASKITLANLKKLVYNTLELDTRLKTESIDADEAMRHYLMSLA